MSARVVQRYVLQTLDDPRLAVFVVWEKIGAHDSPEAARKATMLLPDPRVHFFWSDDRIAGKAFQGAVGIQGTPAWDVFLVYGPGKTWNGEAPPIPDYFMHNQPSHPELPKDRLLNGNRLAEKVKILLAEGESKGASNPPAVTLKTSPFSRERSRNPFSHRLQLPFPIYHRRPRAPDRPGPGGIGRAAGDDVDVELWDDVAQGADVQLVGVEEARQDLARLGDLLDESRSVRRRQVMDLAQRLPLRD
jgi:hypothetical protein